MTRLGFMVTRASLQRSVGGANKYLAPARLLVEAVQAAGRVPVHNPPHVCLVYAPAVKHTPLELLSQGSVAANML